VYYPEHTPRMQHTYRRVADEFGLVATGGSDFHGAISPQLSLGRGFGDMEVPDECFDRLWALCGRVSTR